MPRTLKVSVSLVESDRWSALPGGLDASRHAKDLREQYQFYLSDQQGDAYALTRLLGNSDPIDVADRARDEYDVANVLVDCRLVPDNALDDEGEFEALAQWYFRRFLQWRERTSHHPSLGAPRGLAFFKRQAARVLPNPFERGFQHVFCSFSCGLHSLYADVGVPLDEYRNRQERVRVSSFLKHYDSEETARVTGGVYRLIRLMLECVLKERLKTEKEAGSSAGFTGPQAPSREVTVYVDESLAAPVSSGVATLLNWLQASKTIEQLNASGHRVKLERRSFDDSFCATKFDGAVVFVTNKEHSDQLVFHERRYHYALTNRQRHVIVSDDEQLRSTKTLIYSPANPFVLWDCIWESALKALEGAAR